MPNTDLPLGYWNILNKHHSFHTRTEGGFKELLGGKPYPEDLMAWIERIGWPKIVEVSAQWLALNIAFELLTARSPIEVMLFMALRAEFANMLDWETCRISLNRKLSEVLASGNESYVSRAPWDRRKLKTDDVDYEIDIYLEMGPVRITDNIDNYFRYAIECDGHEFHERTKEQARKDKVKDRFLEERGFSVIHFTGSEIYRNPFSCAEQVYRIYGSERDRLRSLLSPRKSPDPGE